MALSAAFIAPSAHPQSSASQCRDAASFRSFSKQVWALDHWQRRGSPAPAVLAAERRRLKRARGCGYRGQLKAVWERDRQRFREHRKAERERLALTPYDCGGGVRSAVPCYIPYRESGYNPRARNPSSTAGGFYQVLDSTWYAYGGTHYADSYPAAVAPKLEQDRVAARIWADVGCSAWATC